MIISSKLIPALTNRSPPSDEVRNLFALPARLGGIAIADPSVESDDYDYSLNITQPLVDAIIQQMPQYTEEMITKQLDEKKSVHKLRAEKAKSDAVSLQQSLPVPLRKSLELAQESGASAWLTSLPIDEFGFTLHKGAFHDALAIRYNWSPQHAPSFCACGTKFSLEHSLSCPKGGFPSIRHNEIRDLTANLLTEVCSDVCIEPHLQPLSGEALQGASSNVRDGARLDIAANGFWGGRYERTFFDVRIFYPHGPLS